MRWLGRWLKRIILTLVVLVLILLAPIAWIETSCRGTPIASTYTPIVTNTAEHRAESRTFLTYPEWHIVHAYDDYARVIRDGDPHDYGYFSGIKGFWTSLCALSEKSTAHGGFSWETKQTIYTIGVSFTAELGMKALYEETLGRIATMLRGPDHSPLDNLSADQAASYAKFLQQVPWYKWDFAGDIAALNAATTDNLRDSERTLALGLEYGAKAGYAKVIAAAVASVGADELSLRAVVNGLSTTDLNAIESVTVIGEHAQGIEIETPRYRTLTLLLNDLAHRGANFVEIAGNDDIMLTATSDQAFEGALFSFKRQGYGDFRHLIALKVTDLAETLRSFDQGPIRLEHIHDY